MRFNTTLIPFTTLIFITIINVPTTLSRRLNQKFTKSNHPQTIQKVTNDLSLSKNIPPLEDTIDLALLSSLVYEFEIEHDTNCSSFPSIYSDFTNNQDSSLNGNVTFHCHLYERSDQDTQLMIVSRQSTSSSNLIIPTHENEGVDDKRFIAVVFAGTDDFRNTFTDVSFPFLPLSLQFLFAILCLIHLFFFEDKYFEETLWSLFI